MDNIDSLKAHYGYFKPTNNRDSQYFYNDDGYNSKVKFTPIVKTQILPLLSGIKNPTILNLGPLKGKWIPEIIECLSPKKLLLVDIEDNFFDHIKTQFSPHVKTECFLTEGENLKQIPTSTVDYIISIDALTVSAPHGITQSNADNYVKDFKRILKPNGKALVMFPSHIILGWDDHFKITDMGSFGFSKGSFYLFEQ